MVVAAAVAASNIVMVLKSCILVCVERLWLSYCWNWNSDVVHDEDAEEWMVTMKLRKKEIRLIYMLRR